MSTLLSEQIVVQETRSQRDALTALRLTYVSRGVKLSEADAGRMCIANALPQLEDSSTFELVELCRALRIRTCDRKIAPRVVSPDDKTAYDEPLDQQIVVQETPENDARLTALCNQFNAENPETGVPFSTRESLRKTALVRLCFALALPVLSKEATPRKRKAPAATAAPQFRSAG